MIPITTWETVLALIGSYSTELSDILDTYAKLDFNDKELNYSELSMLVNELKILSNNLEQVSYIQIIQNRIDKKLDQAFEISEYRRIITIFYLSLEKTVTSKSTFNSWIDYTGTFIPKYPFRTQFLLALVV